MCPSVECNVDVFTGVKYNGLVMVGAVWRRKADHSRYNGLVMVAAVAAIQTDHSNSCNFSVLCLTATTAGATPTTARCITALSLPLVLWVFSRSLHALLVALRLACWHLPQIAALKAGHTYVPVTLQVKLYVARLQRVRAAVLGEATGERNNAFDEVVGNVDKQMLRLLVQRLVWVDLVDQFQ